MEGIFRTKDLNLYHLLSSRMTLFYWQGDKKIECDMSIVYDGTRQRNMITHLPGVNIYECLPWECYGRLEKCKGK